MSESTYDDTGVPHLLVEVLSSNRRDDLVSKVSRYAAWGAPDHWVLDPRDHAVLTFRNVGGVFELTERLTGGNAVGSFGPADRRVRVAVDALLA